MTANYKHIRFEEIQGFTVCRSNHGGAVLGRVEWMSRWKEYEFIPEPDTAYTVECLRDLADFVGKMNAARMVNEQIERPLYGCAIRALDHAKARLANNSVRVDE